MLNWVFSHKIFLYKILSRRIAGFFYGVLLHFFPYSYSGKKSISQNWSFSFLNPIQ